MALTLGTNAGFVTVPPSTDPSGAGNSIISIAAGGRAKVLKVTSPLTAVKITEVGWWCDNATEAANFEVGLYAADGAVVPGEAGTLLQVSRTNAKGTGSGWKPVTGLNWTISSNTVYWIGVQVDTTATTTNTDFASSGGNGYDSISLQSTLADPFNGGALFDSSTGILAFYAVWEASSTSIKTMNGLAKASVKTADGLAIASVKSSNGLT